MEDEAGVEEEKWKRALTWVKVKELREFGRVWTKSGCGL